MKITKFARNLTLLSTTILLGTMGANAYGPSAARSFYVGIHGGISHTPNKFWNTLNINQPGIEQNNTISDSKKTTGGLGEVTAGVQLLDQSWMTGFELAANIDSQKAKRTFNHGNGFIIETQLKKTYGIIPALVAGRTYQGVKTMLIVKLGMAINRYKLSAASIATGKRVSGSKTLIGFAPSIGVEHPFTNHISGVATMGYEWNRTIKKVLGSPIAATSAEDTLKIKTSAFVGKLGLQFKF